MARNTNSSSGFVYEVRAEYSGGGSLRRPRDNLTALRAIQLASQASLKFAFFARFFLFFNAAKNTKTRERQ